jgi:hypothetical protein
MVPENFDAPFPGSIREHLMMPVYALTATPQALLQMLESDKVVLWQRLTPTDRKAMTIEQKVAINPMNAKPNLLVDNYSDHALVGKFYRNVNNNNAISFTSEVPACNRWYTIVKGLNFTGMCQSAPRTLRVEYLPSALTRTSKLATSGSRHITLFLPRPLVLL